MDLDKPPVRQPSQQQPEGCLVVAIRLPVRIVALVLVLPVRMAWDALVVACRFLNDLLLRPLGRALLWLGRVLVVLPLVGLWRYVVVPVGKALAWLGKVLVVAPLVWCHRCLLTPVGHALVWLYARVLTPAVIGLGAALAWLARYLVVVPARWLYDWVLAPLGRAGRAREPPHEAPAGALVVHRALCPRLRDAGYRHDKLARQVIEG
ncbi:hypothetical protein P1P75_30175, partial [Streptomyces sp. ID05-39B]|nr:hypothetical protein [Streptomyces sp. ID05-39B]